MREINGNRDCIYLGHEQDNESLVVKFNIAKFYSACGVGGQFHLRHKRAIDPDAYPIPASQVELDGNVLTWTVRAEDLVRGGGQLQIKYADGDLVLMSETHKTICEESLGNSATPPDAWSSYIDEVERNAERAEEAASHNPYINSQTDTWWVWDTDEEAYVDTEVSAHGAKGDTGATGNGIASTVLNNDYTLTLTFTNGTTYTTPSIRGEKGATGATGQTGQAGATGAPGQDGVSPTVSVTDITNGHRVVITDASGAHSFDVMDGTAVDLSGYLSKSGGTMTGSIVMGSQKITGLAAGTENGDAVRYEQLGEGAPSDGVIIANKGANLLNPSNIITGSYYSVNDNTQDGRARIELSSNSAFSCAYVDIVPGEDYTCTAVSYNAFTGDADGYAIGIAYYAAQSVTNPLFDSTQKNSNFGNTDKTITRIYFSWRHAYYPTNTFMFVEGTTLPGTYVPYLTEPALNPSINVSFDQLKDVPDLDVVEEYVVDYRGSGDFTTFTSCIRALANNTNKKRILVKAGVYDIFGELGGQTYAESISGQGYSWGDVSDIIPPNTSIIGIGEVVFQFKPTAAQIPSDVASLLSPVNVCYDIYMENITFDCDNCRYAIHDETGHFEGVYGTRHIYKNIKIKKLQTSVGMNAAFGCGMQKGQYMEFDNCKFESPSRPFSFHNSGTDEYYDGTIIAIKNCVAIATSSGGYSLRFGNVNGRQVKITVDVLNTYMNRSNIILNESSTERPNAYAITYVGCGNPTTEVETATNIYTPTVYQI